MKGSKVRKLLEGIDAEPDRRKTALQDFSAVLQQYAEDLTDDTLKEINEAVRGLDGFSRQALEQIAEGIATDFGTFQQLLQSGIDALVDSIRAADSREDVLAAVRAVKVPNYAAQLNRIEQELKSKRVDFTPVLSKLNRLEEIMSEEDDEGDEESAWTFDVERDPSTHLIKSVIARKE